jgi:drug/metabolite transporter (DMT)-like permease
MTRRGSSLTSFGTNRGDFGIADWGLLSGIALIWGSSFLFIAVGLEAFEPGVVTLARVLLGFAALAFVPRARKPIDPIDRPRMAALGLLWIAIPLTLFPIAQQWIDSSVAGMINGAVPIATAVLASLMLGTLPGPRQMLGISIGFAGVALIFVPELRDSSATALGAGLVTVAVVMYGLCANLAVPLQQKYGALPVVLRAQMWSLLVVVPVGLAQVPGSSWEWNSALAMVPLGMLGTGLAYYFMGTLVGRVGGTRGSIAIYFVPVVAILLGVLVRDESVEAIALAGMALVLVGAWATSRREQTG